MKKSKIYILILSVIFLITTDIFAASSRKNYYLKPQIGAWYGPVSPVMNTARNLDSTLGGGIFFRYNLPYAPLKIGLDSSYQSYDSKGVNEVRLIPVYANLLYLLPIDIPLKIHIKGGAGLCNIHMEPDKVKQWDTMFMFGSEVSFPAGRRVNIALRIDYLNIYEEYKRDAKVNGHFINTGISLYFNLF
ncbi:MAG: porin family protein [Spirochaetes bacterium]|nr:porin family protein [Spirochaetota bacterium]